jgi:methionyl-tRNA formyltransferase
VSNAPSESAAASPAVELPLASPPASIRRVAVLGTPTEAATALRGLHAAGFEIPVVVTQPDRRRGRGGKLDPSPVKQAAAELGLNVAHDLDAVAELAAAQAIDLGVVVAYGRIIPRRLLEQVAMVNIHFSLLPRWRGAAPVERAILAGDRVTGVCLMEVAVGLDEGGVYAQAELPIGPEATAAGLRAELAELGSQLLVQHLRSGLGPATAQVGEPSYAKKLAREDFRLDFSRPAVDAHRTVRIGKAWAEFRGKRLVIEAATLVDGSGPAGALDGTVVATPEGRLRLITVKPEGKRAMSADDWVNGAQPQPGERLG